MKTCVVVVGNLQFVTDAISIDALKKSSDYPGTLRGHFEKVYGGANSEVCVCGFFLGGGV
jgi:hypothetical protein